MTPARPPHEALGHRSLVEAALAVARAEGFGGLTMRRLARELGVSAPALYHHVPSKTALLQLVVTAALDEVLPGLAERYEAGRTAADWTATTRVFATTSRRVYLRHPGLAGFLLAQGPPSPAGPVVRAEVDALTRLGVPPGRAVVLYEAGARWILGYVHGESITRGHGEPSGPPGSASSPTRGHNLARVLAGVAPAVERSADEEVFAVGLDWVLRGVEAEIEAWSRGGAPGG